MTSREMAMAVWFIQCILSKDGTADGLYDLMEIQSGNTEILLNHLKAVVNIMNVAIKELEGDIKDEC